MKIYVLSIAEVGPAPSIIDSNFRAQRFNRKVEFYATKELAEKRRKNINEGMKHLIGFHPNVEVIIDEAEVIQ